uniref:Fibronectin leucine rich transmembrane protein 1b n=1 Tax=Xiphophorus couchianus TaxID=32473 RepID=A0A3B5KPI4_9TELE
WYITWITGEGDEGIVCPSVCRCDEGFVYCNDRGLSIIPPLPLTAAILYLQNNGMTHIPRATLDGMKRLQRLDLSGNNLTSLPRGILRDTESLELLLLRGNPWNCGCNLRWLHSWLHGRGSAVTVRGLVCQGPESVRGQSLRDLTSLMEQCEDDVGESQVVPHGTTTTAPLLIPTQGSLFTLRPKWPAEALFLSFLSCLLWCCEQRTTLFSPKELTAVITALTETGDTNHSMGRLMSGK